MHIYDNLILDIFCSDAKSSISAQIQSLTILRCKKIAHKIKVGVYFALFIQNDDLQIPDTGQIISRSTNAIAPF